ncbi:MAG TPA: alkaline phosphatase family protein [Pirellulales bacterium]|jgi:hypothetical protein|nr:alkaline phosphatase family protein [Pirellulales bacterium]
MTDGLRWQEVFAGAERILLDKVNGGVEDVPALEKAYWRDTPGARREALMPFFWSVIARQGQVYGNQAKLSMAQVTNGHNFSYPGYNETLCGYADPRIDSNDKRPNPNVTVFEWLQRKPGFQGRVSAVGCWDVFPFIFNTERCGFYVNAGYDPLVDGRSTERLELLNQLKRELPRKWAGEPFDSLTFHSAFEHLKLRQPRLAFISLNETDAWGHARRYDEYLTAAHRVDGYLKTLWEWLQTIPQYRGKTTLIFCPDHGRGDAPIEWQNHGAKQPESKFIWLAFLGPDTPPLGERSNVAPVTQSQIAATLAALLGEDYAAAVPQAGRPIADVLGPAIQARAAR